MSNSIQAMIPQREVLNQMQMDTLLRAAQTLMSALSHFPDDSDSPHKPSADGGVRMAMDVSLCRILDRIDRVVLENSRWEVDSLKSVEEKLGALYESQRELLEIRKIVESQALAPHMKYKPVLMRVPDGWIAVYGDANFLDKSVVGYGETPALALKCFDLLFEGEVPQGLTDWITKQTQNEKSNQVDGQGTSGTSDDEGNGTISGTDSPKAE